MTLLKSIERDRIALALMKCGFVEEPNVMFHRVFLKKLLSVVDYHIRMSIVTSDTIEVICNRIADTAFRSRGLTKASRKETYRLAERVQRAYIQEAESDPTGNNNIS